MSSDNQKLLFSTRNKVSNTTRQADIILSGVNKTSVRGTTNVFVDYSADISNLYLELGELSEYTYQSVHDLSNRTLYLENAVSAIGEVDVSSVINLVNV